MRMPCKHCRQSAAFTLIELMIVVAIIVLLVSLLLPSLRRAKYQARLGVCASNLRQIVTAATTFATDHNGMYPGYSIVDGSPNCARARSYQNVAPGLDDYCGGSVDWRKNDLWICPEAAIFCARQGINMNGGNYYATHWNSIQALPSGTMGCLCPGGYIAQAPGEALQGPSGARQMNSRGHSFTGFKGGTWESKIAVQDISHLNGNQMDKAVSGHMWGGDVVAQASSPFGNYWTTSALLTANYLFTDGSLRRFQYARPGLQNIAVILADGPLQGDEPIIPIDWLRPL